MPKNTRFPTRKHLGYVAWIAVPVRMGHVVSIETVGIAEDGGCFLKRDAMFLESGNGLHE